MQTWYRVTVQVEPVGADVTTLRSRGRDSNVEHWFDGGARYALFLRPTEEPIQLRAGEPVLLSALIQCLEEEAVGVGTKWLSHVNHQGTIASGQIVAVHEVWSDVQGHAFPSGGEWDGHCHY
jgi:hypothetical protein